MKKIFSLALALLMLASTLFVLASCGDDDSYEVTYVETPYAGTTLHVYNWGEYMPDGSDGSQDVLKLFEKKYDIKVIYDTYTSNEDMYAKLSGDAVSYDIVIPSDYMIAKLIEEDLLQEIDTSSLAGYENIDPKYKNIYYDPENRYSVPYAVGMIGIIYNTTMVDAKDVEKQSWDLMWNPAYTGQILTYDNPRDAFGVAQFLAGSNVNSTNRTDWDAAYQSLLEQKPLLQGWVMDEIFAKMEGGNAAIASYYAGDCLSMIAENPDLAFYYPVEGTNVFVDAMCIPKNATNVGAAKLFIEFMLDPDIASFVANFICYASPNTAVLTNEYYDYKEGTDEYAVLYDTPEAYADGTKTQYYHNLPANIIEYYNQLWSELKRS